MDPSTIAALSGAPATVVLAYFIIALLRDRKVERRDFLRALAAERMAIERLGVTIQRQSALLLTAVEFMAPGRSEAIKAEVTELFRPPDRAEPPYENGEDG
jgi:hypothetical protein